MERKYSTWQDGLDIAIQVCDDIERNAMANMASYQAQLDNKGAQTTYGISIGASKIRSVLRGIRDGRETLPKVDK